jgi:hypothetical protein
MSKSKYRSVELNTIIKLKVKQFKIYNLSLNIAISWRLATSKLEENLLWDQK